MACKPVQEAMPARYSPATLDHVAASSARLCAQQHSEIPVILDCSHLDQARWKQRCCSAVALDSRGRPHGAGACERPRLLGTPGAQPTTEAGVQHSRLRHWTSGSWTDRYSPLLKAFTPAFTWACGIPLLQGPNSGALAIGQHADCSRLKPAINLPQRFLALTAGDEPTIIAATWPVADASLVATGQPNRRRLTTQAISRHLPASSGTQRKPPPHWWSDGRAGERDANISWWACPH